MKKMLVALAMVIVFLPALTIAGESRGQKHTVLRWGNTPGSYVELDFSEAQTIGNSTDIPVNYGGDPSMMQALILRIFDAFQSKHPELKIIGKQELYMFFNGTTEPKLHVFSVRIDHEPRKK
jgi:hypothetical protein